MNELLYQLGWILKGYEFIILLWFLVVQFPKYRWSLFFVYGKALNTLRIHELHSCFMTILCIFVFHLMGSEAGRFFIESALFDISDKIKVFYLAGMLNQFLFLVVLFIYHRLRGCLFSLTARICSYTTLIMMTLQFMELVARGYYDYHDLGLIYILAGWSCNIIQMLVLSIYPVRQTLAYFKYKCAASHI